MNGFRSNTKKIQHISLKNGAFKVFARWLMKIKNLIDCFLQNQYHEISIHNSSYEIFINEQKTCAKQIKAGEFQINYKS